MAGIIMTDDIKAMADEVKKLGEASTAMRGALLAAANGSDALAVRTILLDSVQIADAAIRGIHQMADVQPRQQSLPEGEQLDVTVAEELVGRLLGAPPDAPLRELFAPAFERLLADTLASCEAGDVQLDQRCPCGPEIQQVASDCLAAVAAAEAAAISREQDVADNAAAELQEQTDWTNTRIRDTTGILADQIADVRAATDALRDQLADLRWRVEVLEGAP